MLCSVYCSRSYAALCMNIRCSVAHSPRVIEPPKVSHTASVEPERIDHMAGGEPQPVVSSSLPSGPSKPQSGRLGNEMYCLTTWPQRDLVIKFVSGLCTFDTVILMHCFRPGYCVTRQS
jgi:hypothetical protein